VYAAELIGRQNPDQQRNAADADQRDGIRQVHRDSALFPGAQTGRQLDYPPRWKGTQ
jgi:hypothetical protein